MIKSIKPGLLAGKTDEQISAILSLHMECEVDYFDFTAKIRCFDEYSSNTKIAEHMARLRKVGRVFWGCDRLGPFVGLEFNDIARGVITGVKNA